MVFDGYTGNSLNGPINFGQVNASGTPQSGTQLTGPPCGLTSRCLRRPL